VSTRKRGEVILEYRGWQITGARSGSQGEYAASMIRLSGSGAAHTSRYPGPGARDKAIRAAKQAIDKYEDHYG